MNCSAPGKIPVGRPKPRALGLKGQVGLKQPVGLRQPGGLTDLGEGREWDKKKKLLKIQ